MLNNNKLYYGRHYIDKLDVQNVSDALLSENLTSGNYLDLFEKKLSFKFGSKYSLAVTNGTAALYIALRSLEIPQGKYVITSPITFVASAAAAELNNLKIDFCDIDIKTYNIDLNLLEKKLIKNRKIIAVIAVDYAGNPCDWSSLKYLSKKYNFYLINDNCHSLGSKYKNSSKYAVQYSDIVCQSYHPVKNFTTAEGGSILTNNEKIYKISKRLRNHNIIRKNLWSYDIKSVSMNFRMNELSCALGISQLSKLDSFIKKRRENALYYDNFFSKFNKFFRIPERRIGFYNSYHIYPLLINFKKLKLSKEELFNRLMKSNIVPQIHYKPLHLLSYFKKKYNFRRGDFKISEKFYDQVVSIPNFYTLTTKQLSYVCQTFCKIFKI